jgi:thiol:disulfide interchange protein
MKRLLLLAFVMTLGSADTTRAQVQFEDLAFEDALKKAEAEGRDVFVYLWTEWCAPCRQIEAIAFADSAVAIAIGEYVPVKLNAEEGEGVEVNARYEVGGYPTFLFLNSGGTELGRVSGTRSNPGYVMVIKSRGSDDPEGERIRRLRERQDGEQ